jgi:hypothetical protein
MKHSRLARVTEMNRIRPMWLPWRSKIHKDSDRSIEGDKCAAKGKRRRTMGMDGDLRQR